MDASGDVVCRVGSVSNAARASSHIITLTTQCTGRYLVIRASSEAKDLTLCKVSAFAACGQTPPAPVCNPATDLATLKPTTQSSTGWSGFSYYPVMSNATGAKCVAVEGKGGWWALDLGEEVHVAAVVVLNRVDCCADRCARGAA